MDYKYKETVIENVEEGTKVFLTTDGYLDQNGGEKGFPFGKKRFIQIIEDYGEESMADLQEMFMYEMAEWEEQVENNDRNDDMTVIGFTI
jgi:serine phosphatase RsbU (regulator of sigma subunit)